MEASFSFWVSKIVWAVLAPSHLVVIFLLLSFVAALPAWLRLVMRFFSAIFLFMALFMPIGQWAMVPLERCLVDRNPPMQVDGIIVLGGGINADLTLARQQPSYNSAVDRLLAMPVLLKTYPQAQLVYTGGSGSLKYPEFREADYAKRFLLDLGLNTDGAIFETESRNTYENMLKTKDIFGKIKGQNWLLVTSAYHMPRALALFEKGSEDTATHFYPYMVDYQSKGAFKFTLTIDLPSNLSTLDLASKEYLGLLYAHLRKQTNDLWPCGKRKAVVLQ